jgi:hypothetical protein
MSTKDAYVKEMQTQLDEFSEEIVRLKAGAKKVIAKTKNRQDDQIAILEARHESAQKKLRELKDSSGNAWEDLRMGIVSAWDSVRDALVSAAEQFK